MNTMNDYEKVQFDEICKWEKEEPSVLKKTTGFVMKPIEWITNKIIPQKVIQTALQCANSAAQYLTDEKDIISDSEVNCISELKTKDLQISDNLANEVHNWALALASTEGGVCGYFGLPGMVVDIPMIVTFALRTIHKIGLCYGYKTITPGDTQFVYHIMSTAGANTMNEKNMALITLKQLYVIINKQTWKGITEKAGQKVLGNESFIIAIKTLAKQLGINLTKRKALQTIPLIGSGVGLAMNAAFINDISWAARRCFQKRWLADNDKIALSKE